MAFNPNEKLTKLKGKDYLEVKWRLVWFRDLCPEGEITTDLLHFDPEKGIAVFKAVVKDGRGGEASGHGSETAKDFGDFLEKAETKAIGRALAALGYGTQFSPEMEEGSIVDSPVAQGGKSNGHKPQVQGEEPAPDTPALTLIKVKHHALQSGVAKSKSEWQSFTAEFFGRFIPDEQLKDQPDNLFLLDEEITTRARVPAGT